MARRFFESTNCIRKIHALVWVAITALANHNPAIAQQPFVDFWAVPGKEVNHPFKDSDDVSSDQLIIERTNEKGLPIGFAKEVHKVVCVTGNCRIVDLWLYWDGVGDYLGFSLYKNRPLTKTDHVDFGQEDYEKLHGILADRESILGRLEQKDLTIEPKAEEPGVDGHSGATQPSLQEYLVRDAAYTCYALWHTVYGPIQEKIKAILDQKADTSFLTLLLDQAEPKYKIWALDFIQRNPLYYPPFRSRIIDLIKSEEDVLSRKAMRFFGAERLAETSVQTELASRIDEFPDQRRYELLWELGELDHIPAQTIAVLLDKFGKNQIKAPHLGYVYKLIRPKNLKDDNVSTRLRAFLKHENLYVRNLTTKLLADLGFPGK